MEPVTLDALDRRLVHALQIDARASFGRIAEVLGSTDRTLARRYHRLRAAGLLRVVGVPAARALGQSEWLVRLRCLPAAATRIAEVLAARADTTWVAIVSGGAELTCLTRSADELVLATMPRSPRIMEVTAQRLLRAVAGVDGWPRRLAALTDDEVAALRPGAPQVGAAEPTVLSAPDRRVLELLARDGRVGWSALAAATGWSPTTVARRVTELRERGTLLFDVDVEPRLFGASTEAIMWLTVAPESLERAAAALARHPDVAYAAVATGPTNLVAYLACTDDDALYEGVLLPVGRIGGVRHVDLAPIARQVTRSSPAAARWR
ncbi:Lrp/AsnC family transcriptional regulator [Pseudonocardia sp. CA-107938]|uniref:Lrp/AsnC family transcriptional regulator n=1 Tax=Pseudonocardia sp. CA-107938 TaxID=3240021 RepID=UPI003D950807